jgi:predicted peptidase
MMSAEPDSPRFVARTVVADGVRMKYQLFVPRASGERPPIVLSLHGSGERGDDGEAQLRVGLGPAVRAAMDTFPAIVVFPQAPNGAAWTGATAHAAMAALEAAAAELGADPRRTYLTGISMGGFGTWQLALEHPERFAALVPICGGLRPVTRHPEIRVCGPAPDEVAEHAYVAARTAAIPSWLFHGADDRQVPPEESRAMVRALESVGAPVRYTEYPGVGHNSWDLAYATPELWSWLFAQRLRS